LDTVWELSPEEAAAVEVLPRTAGVASEEEAMEFMFDRKDWD
jgi:hypothetical protein